MPMYLLVWVPETHTYRYVEEPYVATFLRRSAQAHRSKPSTFGFGM